MRRRVLTVGGLVIVDFVVFWGDYTIGSGLEGIEFEVDVIVRRHVSFGYVGVEPRMMVAANCSSLPIGLEKNRDWRNMGM